MSQLLEKGNKERRKFKDLLDVLKGEELVKEVSVVETRIYRKKKLKHSMDYINTPEKAGIFGKMLFKKYYDREYVYVLGVSAKFEPLCVHLLSMGGHSSSLVDPTRVFTFAMLSSAHSIVLYHNDISGISLPSREDEIVTKRIKECGQLLGIPLADHLIICNEEYYSMKEGGYL